MSYCVNCGVELHSTAVACPLCDTPVLNPRQPIDTLSPQPFPTAKEDIPPVSKLQAAILISAMLASVAMVCGGANVFFLRPERGWSLYVIGAAVMFWLWLVPPLLFRNMPLGLRLFVDTGAIGVYLYLISLDLHGQDWFFGLALPIVLTGAGVVLVLGLLLSKGKRSILTGITLVVLGCGIFLMSIELWMDLFFHDSWAPSWSIVVGMVCIALLVPLLIVRHVPSFREEVRRRFHM